MTKRDKELVMRCLKFLHFLVNSAFFVGTWMVYKAQDSLLISDKYTLFVCLLYAFLTYSFCRVYNAYLIGYSRNVDIILSLSLTNVFSWVVVYVATLVFLGKYFTPKLFLIMLAVQIIHNILWTVLASLVYYKLHAPEGALIVYEKKRDLDRLLEIQCFKKRFRADRYLERPKSSQEIIEASGDSSVIFLIGIDASLQNDIAKYCVENNIAGYFLPHVGNVIMMGGHHIQAFSMPLMRIPQVDRYPESVAAKRLFDIVLSLLAILITSPIMLATALAIHLQDGGPVFYQQIRLTKNGKEFSILKFRSMITDAEKDGIARLSSGEADSRITPIGKIIRATRIDELPQLFNILLGDMSFVGPRPERPEIAAQYAEVIPEFRLRLKVKAGLTGYAQIYGKYNTDPYEKLLMDLIYISKMSFLLDIRLIFATVRVLFIKGSSTGVKQGDVTAFDSEIECKK